MTAERTIARDRPGYLVAAVSAMLVLSVYWQVGGHGFVRIDDGLYVTENPVVLRGLTPDGVKWAFSTFHASNWHPLTWISHMLDVELFGRSAGWHHRVSVLFHLLNTELLFLVLWRMTGALWPSAAVAVLFGVHPLHVESVAWVAERKDVLSTLFWILTMGAYLRYVRRPGPRRYLLVVALFALGLMCKPMLVTLPFVLLLLDWWPLGRLSPQDGGTSGATPFSLRAHSGLLLEKVPLLALAAASGAMTYSAQATGGALNSVGVVPLASRISNACVSYAAYLAKMAWPSSLSVFYPHPAIVRAGSSPWTIAGAILLLVGLSGMTLRWGRRRPYLAVGWLWYLGTLVPVIGLVQMGDQAMADRYTYVPLIGPFLAIAWGVSEVTSGRHLRRVALAAFGAAALALTLASRVQAGYWRDDVTLFSRAVALDERNYFALIDLGLAFHDLGQTDRAISCFRGSLRIRPDHVQAWYNLGLVYNTLGQNGQAIYCWREALRIKPDFGEAWNNLGMAFYKLGQFQQAAAYYREALRLKPDLAEAWNNLGVLYDRLGRPREAVGPFREALRINPGFAAARKNLDAVGARIGRTR